MISDDPFGAHGASSKPTERSAKARRLSSKIAKGLSAEAAPEKPQRRGSDQRSKAKSGPSQEEMQRKIEILMANPKLWQEFKQYLAERDIKTGMGTQKALREFIEKNEEIALKDSEQVEQTRRTSGLGRGLLGAVNALTADLESEEASPNRAPQNTNISAESSAGKSRVADAARSSFTSATNMGMQFIKRAGEVATSSMTGLDKEAEASVEDMTESLNASSLFQASAFADMNASSSDFVAVLGEWFRDEAINNIPEGEEEDDEGESSKERDKDTV